MGLLSDGAEGTDLDGGKKPQIKDQHRLKNQPSVLNPQTAWGLTMSRLPYSSPRGWQIMVVW